MPYDLDQFGRELSQRLDWLLSEIKRLAEENERLLRENKELREEATLARLHTELGSGSELPDELVGEKPREPVLTGEALQFYRALPEKINFPDFFRLAEAADLTSAQAREIMLSYFRHGLLQQRGRRLEKATAKEGVRHCETQDA